MARGKSHDLGAAYRKEPIVGDHEAMGALPDERRERRTDFALSAGLHDFEPKS